MINKIPDFAAVIYSIDYSQQQAVFCLIEETCSGKVDITVTTPVTVDTSRRDLEQDIIVALKDNGFHEVINQVYTVNHVRP